jgi:GNAT superfamily N-acetyltransferase
MEEMPDSEGAQSADAAEFLAAYDAQMRGWDSMLMPKGAHQEEDGPICRRWGLGLRGFVSALDLSPLAGPELDTLIQRQIEFFAERSLAFEWKTFSHDRTADLTGRLLSHGFVPEVRENLVIGRVSAMNSQVKLPPGVTIRQVRFRTDTDRMAELLTEIAGEDRSLLSQIFFNERRANPDHVFLLVGEFGGKLVATARLNLEPRTQFASFWSGSTRPEWRRQGIYRAMVAYRARLAEERGYRFLHVDATENSRPVLERLGFLTVGGTTPYIWTPTI